MINKIITLDEKNMIFKDLQDFDTNKTQVDIVEKKTMDSYWCFSFFMRIILKRS